MPGCPTRHVSRITMRISSFHFPPPLHGIRPFFSFARQQVLLPRKAFWGIACALALRGDLCYPAREVIR